MAWFGGNYSFFRKTIVSAYKSIVFSMDAISSYHEAVRIKHGFSYCRFTVSLSFGLWLKVTSNISPEL